MYAAGNCPAAAALAREGGEADNREGIYLFNINKKWILLLIVDFPSKIPKKKEQNQKRVSSRKCFAIYFYY